VTKPHNISRNIKLPALTKTTIKRAIGALNDMHITQYEMVIEGNAMRIIVGKKVDDGQDLGRLIDSVT